ncbi:uncharacterized protein VDAG_03885 [Verticillium dahliae VdLs.17]|uniref:Uncharacterized protein n=1 Tax=Verticillium dahliae (strain VdLs.17 / ATCC MYA-4575 / FGSC 10137) TaxID=498257 RepID=G2X0V6_VERDV|nr:uncharacterized protein VDAG_03885 [Verticillium dahliae VdLs.17]EGY22447.1 hypothetical protein VDAG_03885 [Verticillium dahliae VdLs.17]KAH6667113.1 hypothetical protein EV126DRAFT_447164 [Verticillium dahliae]KAH6704865.1 hypothetical protein EV126DRAFT_440541 [Verticillium dahliae]
MPRGRHDVVLITCSRPNGKLLGGLHIPTEGHLACLFPPGADVDLDRLFGKRWNKKKTLQVPHDTPEKKPLPSYWSSHHHGRWTSETLRSMEKASHHAFYCAKLVGHLGPFAPSPPFHATRAPVTAAVGVRAGTGIGGLSGHGSGRGTLGEASRERGVFLWAKPRMCLAGRGGPGVRKDLDRKPKGAFHRVAETLFSAVELPSGGRRRGECSALEG